MLGEAGAVLYVGKSRRLRTRLLSYFRARGRKNKAAAILKCAFSIEWDYSPTEFGALLNELHLIKKFRPCFNSVYADDDQRRVWISISNDPVPAIRIVSKSDDPSAAALFGPFRRVAQVKDAVRALVEVMNIRDCTIESANATEPKGVKLPTLWFEDDAGSATGNSRLSRSRMAGCLRYEFKSCSGPCLGKGTRSEYMLAINEIHRFLSGESQSPVDIIKAQMTEAAEAMEFERAAVLRDRLALLEWLNSRVRRFRADADRLSFRYHAKTFDGGEQLYFIRRGTVRAELSSSNPTVIAELSNRIFNAPDTNGTDIPLHDIDEFHLVASWFRRHPNELALTVAPTTI